MMWVRLAAAITVFVASCFGLGYLAGFWVRRYKWPEWVGGLMAFLVSCLWPVAVVGYTIFDARRYQAQHPYDDAPGMVVVSVMTVGAPILFFLSLPLACIGLYIARRWASGGALR